MTRREFTITTAAASIAIGAAAEGTTEAAPALNAPPVRLTINGAAHVAEVDVRTSILDYLRERVGLTGTKKGCDHGQCGACTIHINGKRTLSCLTFVVMHDGDRITTIEGLANGSDLHPMQSAFVAHDGYQCGYCTPGQIMSAVAMVEEPWGSADADVAEAMSGNICRCGAYQNIVAAIQSVRAKEAAT